MVLLKNWKIFQIYILGKIGQKNVFYVILKGTNAFLDYINKKLENLKNWTFPKGLVHDFGQKLVIFPDFYFRENKPEKCFKPEKVVLPYSR